MQTACPSNIRPLKFNCPIVGAVAEGTGGGGVAQWSGVVVSSSSSSGTRCFFQAEDGIRDYRVTGVQTCPLPIRPPLACPPGRAAPTPRQQHAPPDPPATLP